MFLLQQRFIINMMLQALDDDVLTIDEIMSLSEIR